MIEIKRIDLYQTDYSRMFVFLMCQIYMGDYQIINVLPSLGIIKMGIGMIHENCLKKLLLIFSVLLLEEIK